MRCHQHYLYIASALLLAAAVGCQNVSKSSKANREKQLSGEYNAILNSQSKIKISDRSLVAIYDPAEAGTSDGFSNEKFETNLYPLLKANCANGGCHDSNKYPFASTAPFQAAEAAKPYVNIKDPESSKMVQNIKAGHNGVSADLASQFVDAIKKMGQ